VKTFKLIYILILFIPLSIFAQIGGTSTYKFLDLVNSGRVASLGGNNISLNDGDLNLVYQNPSLLNASLDNALVFNYVSYFANINWGYMAYAKNCGKLGTFAGGLHFIDYGTFIQADEVGNKLGEFSAGEYALNIFWAKPIDSLWTVGVNLKPIYSKLETYYSIGIATDLSVNYYKASQGYSASFVIRNLGTQIKPYYSGHYEKVGYDIQAGISKKLLHAPFRFSITAQHIQKPNLNYVIPTAGVSLLNNTTISRRDMIKKYSDMTFRHAIFGLEFVPSKSFIVSVGYNHQRHQEMKMISRSGAAGFSWGVCINVKKFTISYGRAIYHVVGGANHFSIQINLNQFYTKH